MDRESVAAHLHKTLPDYLEGYFVCGAHAATGEPIARFWAPDRESVDRLNRILEDVVAAGGLQFQEEPQVKEKVETS